MNRFTFTCRLTADPETRYTQEGNPVARFGVAVQRTFKRENEPDADFFSCIAFGKTAERFDKLNIAKGTKLLIEGEVRNNNYRDKNGIDRRENQVIVNSFEFCESKQNSPAQAQNTVPRSSGSGYSGYSNQNSFVTQNTRQNDGFMPIPDSVSDDGLPFA